MNNRLNSNGATLLSLCIAGFLAMYETIHWTMDYFGAAGVESILRSVVMSLVALSTVCLGLALLVFAALSRSGFSPRGRRVISVIGLSLIIVSLTVFDLISQDVKHVFGTIVICGTALGLISLSDRIAAFCLPDNGTVPDWDQLPKPTFRTLPIVKIETVTLKKS